MTFPLKTNLGSALLLGLVLAVAVVSPTDVYAQRADKEKEGEKPAGPAIDAATGKILTEAIDALNADNFAGAAAAIAKLNMEKLSPYEAGRTQQILATIADARGDQPAAQKHLQLAVDSGGLNEQEMSQARYQIAQLWLAQEKWKEGAAALEAWISTATNPNSSAYYLLAVAYYQQDLFKQALPPAQKAVDLAESPQESWIQLVLALHLQQENWKESVPLLVRLIGMFPEKKTYWVQLSTVYGQLEQFPKALAAMQLAYEGGLIVDESEITRLADLLMFNNVPYRCATVLGEALDKKTIKAESKNYQKQANCWIAAREYQKALGPLGRAADLASDGALFVRLGEVHIQLNEWEGATKALTSGINKGGLQDANYAQLMLGIALYNQEKYGPATDWFQKARASTKHRRTADGYIQLIKANRAGP